MKNSLDLKEKDLKLLLYIFYRNGGCDSYYKVEDFYKLVDELLSSCKSLYNGEIKIDCYCFKKISQTFPEFKIDFENYFSCDNNAIGAYYMFKYYNSDKKWAKKIIENSKNGSFAAYLMAMEFELIEDYKWAEEVIEINRDPKSAYLMLTQLKSSKSWAEKVIEESNSSKFACLMFKGRYSTVKWAMKIIERCKDEHESLNLLFDSKDFKLIPRIKKIIEEKKNSKIAFNLFRDFLNRDLQEDREWIRKIVEETNDSFVAYRLYYYYEFPKSWAEQIIEKNNDLENAIILNIDSNYPLKLFNKIVSKNSIFNHKIISLLLIAWGANDDFVRERIKDNVYWSDYFKMFPGFEEKAKEYFLEIKNVDALYNMTRYYDSSLREKVEKIIEEEKNEKYAYLMYLYCGSDKEWTKKVVEESGDTKKLQQFYN